MSTERRCPPTSMSSRTINLRRHFPEVTFGPGVQVLGVKNVIIGRGSCIGADAWLNVCVRDHRIRIALGPCVLIGRRGVINTGGHLEIGAYTALGPNVYVGDADHVYTKINVPLLAAGATTGRSLTVEENCWLAMNCVVSGRLTIGRGSVVGANSVVTRDVPPFSVVVGNPAKIVKMYDPVCEIWMPIRTPKNQNRVLRNRQKKPFPSREAYLKTLRAHGFKQVYPIVAGGESM